MICFTLFVFCFAIGSQTCVAPNAPHQAAGFAHSCKLSAWCKGKCTYLARAHPTPPAAILMPLPHHATWARGAPHTNFLPHQGFGCGGHAPPHAACPHGQRPLGGAAKHLARPRPQLGGPIFVCKMGGPHQFGLWAHPMARGAHVPIKHGWHITQGSKKGGAQPICRL